MVTLLAGQGRCACEAHVSVAEAHARASVRTDDPTAPALRDHLFGPVLVAEHYAARVHRHQLVKRCQIKQELLTLAMGRGVAGSGCQSRDLQCLFDRLDVCKIQLYLGWLILYPTSCQAKRAQ
jgi:hypothetical protein